MVSYCRPIVTLCLKCTVFEISQHIGRKSPKKPTPLSFDAPCPTNPTNIRTYLILLENAIFGLHFAADSRPVGLSSFKFFGGLRNTDV